MTAAATSTLYIAAATMTEPTTPTKITSAPTALIITTVVAATAGTAA